MLYQAFQAYEDLTAPLRAVARGASRFLGQPWEGRSAAFPGVLNPFDGMPVRWAAAWELIARAGLSHDRPEFGIESVRVHGHEVVVREEIAVQTPFCNLVRFVKQGVEPQPRVLMVAPLSGHFATLLRGTVRTMLPDHDVYITDWRDAQGVPLREGRFDLDDFIAHLIGFCEHIGAPSHVVAICQPAVAALAAVAIMAEDANPAQPRSLTLMAGPIDTRINPTKVNEFATSHPIEWFSSRLIGRVPARYPGAGREVYPGFMQLLSFMSLNLDRHMKAFRDLYDHAVHGDTDKAEAIRTFYDEYFAVMDMPAEYYLQTVSAVFQQHALPRGELRWRGRKVDPAAIRRMALLTVEGERDDICAVGQTLAAQELCCSLRPYKKTHKVQTAVGHYGVFAGRRWNDEIYPLVRDTIHMSQ